MYFAVGNDLSSGKKKKKSKVNGRFDKNLKLHFTIITYNLNLNFC